jgi:hypothetical protein
VGLERGPLSLVYTIEELLGRNSSGSGLENREYGRRDPLRWPRDTLYPQKLALTSPASGGRSVGIVRLRTKAPECFLSCFVESREIRKNIHRERQDTRVSHKYNCTIWVDTALGVTVAQGNGDRTGPWTC